MRIKITSFNQNAKRQTMDSKWLETRFRWQKGVGFINSLPNNKYIFWTERSYNIFESVLLKNTNKQSNFLLYRYLMKTYILLRVSVLPKMNLRDQRHGPSAKLMLDRFTRWETSQTFLDDSDSAVVMELLAYYTIIVKLHFPIIL